MYYLLFIGASESFNLDKEEINQGYMFAFIKNVNGKAKVSNKIFESRIYAYFTSEAERDDRTNKDIGIAKHEVLAGGSLNMELLLRKFARHYREIFSNRDISFLERHGRQLFLTYLMPFINGEGFYYAESEMGDFRLDVVVNYKREQHIVELKVWRGEKYEKMAHEQLANYLEIKNANKGYLLTFDFRKEVSNERKEEWIKIGEKDVFSVMV